MVFKPQINDVVKTPKGIATVLRINRNGIIMMKMVDYPHDRLFDFKTTVGKWPLVDRPKIRREMIFGKGTIGTGQYRSIEGKQPTIGYRAWRSMLQRVYAPPSLATARAYADVSICQEWHDFQNFAGFFYGQLNRCADAQNPNIKWVLDKDLLIPRNRIYRPDACCVIPQQVNSLLVFHRADRSLPIGVYRIPDSLWFQAQCSGKEVGRFPTIQAAQLAYWEAKFQIIREAAVLWWNHMPEPLAMRLVQFSWKDARDYFGEDILKPA